MLCATELLLRYYTMLCAQVDRPTPKNGEKKTSNKTKKNDQLIVGFGVKTMQNKKNTMLRLTSQGVRPLSYQGNGIGCTSSSGQNDCTHKRGDTGPLTPPRITRCRRFSDERPRECIMSSLSITT